MPPCLSRFPLPLFIISIALLSANKSLLGHAASSYPLPSFFTRLFLSLSLSMTVDVLCRHAAWTFFPLTFPLNHLWVPGEHEFELSCTCPFLLLSRLFSFSFFSQIPTVSVRNNEVSLRIHHLSSSSSGLKDRSISSPRPNFNSLPCSRCAFPRVRASWVSGAMMLYVFVA